MSDLKSRFIEVYGVLKQELLNDPAFEFDNDSRQWVDRVIPLTLSFFFFNGSPCVFLIPAFYIWLFCVLEFIGFMGLFVC